MTDGAAAITNDLDLRISRAREAGVRIEVSVIDGDREDVWIVGADAVTVDGVRLKVRTDDGTLEFPYAGPQALPVLPSIVPVDRAHALRAQTIAALEAIGGVDGNPVVLRFADGRNEAMTSSELMHVASTGIYPSSVLGMDWSEVSSIRATDDTVTVLSARDGSVGLSMSLAG